MEAQSPHRCKNDIVTFEPRQTAHGTEFPLLSFFFAACELIVLDDVAKVLKVNGDLDSVALCNGCIDSKWMLGIVYLSPNMLKTLT